MSGFDTHWLALREPADRAARHPGLINSLAEYLRGQDAPLVLDIGCGTGSTWRSLAGRLPAGTRWLMLDNDPLLLDEAARRIGSDDDVTFHRHDLNDVEGLPLEGVSVVTASALFDLCSERFCAALADRLAAARCGLYAALNYDGSMRWFPPHPLDAGMVELFNRHQRTDKGFGPALGPDAVACLTRQLAKRGFFVRTGDSPWRLDADMAELDAELLKGLRGPLIEMSGVSDVAIDDWLAYRLAGLGKQRGSDLVGHTDILALPV
ncbi:class I SAM-dependent methyltransferase [Rhizobium sp. GN54]|uniref:class I SAM-dependent methyltransferase n=1 Tax=Rhizobium sp. GN54 TaxID=2898150 RepID=UPI001E48A300|nr:class I SAM-dependent methyltransferase [Rhizobium sp. GN54]MCD2184655.1 class I SAM-dependent methyltransferase [Rhizobium sp. GN54]